LILADTDGGDSREQLIELVCDIDDMNPEYLAATLDQVRARGALDVISFDAGMKQGRHGTRVEVLCRPADAGSLEDFLLSDTTTIGVRRREVERRALSRSVIRVTLLGHEITAKVVVLPNGSRRAKPEFVDVHRVALATGRPLQDISKLANAEAERHLES